MQAKIKKRSKPTKHHYHKTDLEIAYDFAKKIYKEFSDLLKAVVLFGGTTKSQKDPKGDIDVLIVVDDVSIELTRELVAAYRVILTRLVGETSTKLHVNTMKFTSFWEYIRAGDPVAINILRDGHALIDTGFFDPLQRLLFTGRIRPTNESIWVYFTRAPQNLEGSKIKVMQAAIDLYWGVIDAAHAALMTFGHLPPTPEHVGDLLDVHLVKPKLIERKYVNILNNFYRLQKMIMHREIREIKGEEYDRYYRDANAFVLRMQELIRKKQKETIHTHKKK